ncbi:MAG: hypothetical protein WCF84_26735 [Anaerolineae bacterium]
MMRLQVLSPWVGTGTDADPLHPLDTPADPFRAQISDDYTLVSRVDVTGQPRSSLIPAPNVFVVEVVCDDTVAAAIDADPKYAVLWSEPA